MGRRGLDERDVIQCGTVSVNSDGPSMPIGDRSLVGFEHHVNV